MKLPAASRIKNTLSRTGGRFLLALSFMSRLAPARVAAEAEIAASLAWYPAAGLALGLVLALPFALLEFAAPLFLSAKAWLAALAFTALHAWLTRALHWDGWADLFDAMGGGRDAGIFQKILKDSRLGAFGGLALGLGLAAMLLASAHCLAAGAWPALAWAVLLGRCLVAPLVWRALPMPGSSLGRLLLDPAPSDSPSSSSAAARSFARPLAALLFALAAGVICVGAPAALAALALALAGVLFLRRLAAKQGGMNGDYMGAAVTWGELAGLLTAAWFQSFSPFL